MFQLNKEEVESLRSQFATSNDISRSQFATSNKRGGQLLIEKNGKTYNVTGQQVR